MKSHQKLATECRFWGIAWTIVAFHLFLVAIYTGSNQLAGWSVTSALGFVFFVFAAAIKFCDAWHHDRKAWH